MDDIMSFISVYLLNRLHTFGTLFLLATCVFSLWLIIRGKDNNLEWADLISSIGLDGKQHADINKIGKCMGVVMATYLPLIYVNSDKFDPANGTLLMGASLAYLGAVDAYSVYIKSKQEKPNAG